VSKGIFVALALAAVGAAGYFALRQSGGRALAGAAGTRTAKVTTGDLRRTLRLGGTIGAKEFAAMVAPRMQGRSFGGGGGGDRGGFGEGSLTLIKLAKPGGPVTKGEVVAEFDRQTMLQTIEEQQSVVLQNEADIVKRKAELAILRDTAEQNLRRAKADVDKARLDLKTAEVRSEIEAEKLKLAYEEAVARHKQLSEEIKLLAESHQADIRTLEIQRDQAKLSKTRAEINAERMLMRSPIDGIVVLQPMFRSGGVMTQAQEGEQVNPGANFAQIVNPSAMVMNAVINQADSQQLRMGQRAEIRIDAYPSLVAEGKVLAIGAMATSGGGGMGGRGGPGRGPGGGGGERYVKQIPVRLSIETQDPRIIPDLSASASVILDDAKGVIVPRAAIEQDQDKFYVQVRGASGSWERRQVEVGLTSNDQASIRKGLTAGEEVALEKPSTPAK